MPRALPPVLVLSVVAAVAMAACEAPLAPTTQPATSALQEPAAPAADPPDAETVAPTAGVPTMATGTPVSLDTPAPPPASAA